MNVTEATLQKLDFVRVRDALAERTSSSLGTELARSLGPGRDPADAETSLERIAEILRGPAVSLGGVHDVRPLVARVRDGRVLDGPEILEIAYTMDAAGTIRRSILASERPALGELALRMGSFDGALRLVREQLDPDGNVRDDATPKLREIRRRLQPLRGRIRERLQALLERYSEFVQDPIITLRRDRYVIPVKANMQSRVPGIALDVSDSGATVFLEPQAVVPMNNELAILEFEDRDEVRRILVALGQRLAYEPGLDESIDALAELDLANAAARLATDWRLARPRFDDGGRVHLPGARHPLIEGCIPNDVELDAERRLLVITGPNAGGKTVLIKTLGLAAIMAHSGLFVAASERPGPTLPRFDALLVDIGDEQSIEASLSTYAGHLVNLGRIVREANDRVLVLIDELGSGTDPAEGAALSQAILERILASGARGLVTTHLAPLKVFASETRGVRNAAMAFDLERLGPRFELVIGQPGRSYALSIAERLELPEELIERARDILGPEGAALESLLETLQAERERLLERSEAAEEERVQAEREARLLREQIETLRRREDEVLAAAAGRAESMLQETLERAKELRRVAREDPQARSKALEELQSLRREYRERSRKPEAKSQAGQPGQGAKGAGPSKPELSPGVVVRVESYGAEGPIVEVRGDSVLVQLGLLKVEVPKRDVRRVKEAAAPKRRTGGVAAPARFDEELNIRGERVEEGLEKVRDFIVEAHALKAPRVRILHGKGTGTLRDAVRSYLKGERLVERYEDAVPYEGGHGVTVAYLRH